jgi:uncharacterized membrane protein (UPF0127 family)
MTSHFFSYSPASFCRRLFPKQLFLFAILLPFFAAGCSEDDSRTAGELNRESATTERNLTFPGHVEFFRNDPEEAEDQEQNSITSVDVALALNDEQRQLGLMNVHRLPSSKGMLFIFDEQEPLSFWMANTPLSLDIIFVNEDMQIVRIHSGTTPYSRQQYPSERPARYVVEVTAGFTARHDIQEGQYIAFDLGDS